eukprot:2904620-Prorocentrum_lima.AAC.1
MLRRPPAQSWCWVVWIRVDHLIASILCPSFIACKGSSHVAALDVFEWRETAVKGGLGSLDKK